MTIPNNSQTITNPDGTVQTSWYRFFQDVCRIIRGDLGIRLGGILENTTTATNSSGASETDLITYSLAANRLKDTGDLVEIEAWGGFAANANSKTVKLYLGSEVVHETEANAANDGFWRFKATIIRKDASNQEAISTLFSNNSTVQDDAEYPVNREALTQDLSTALIIKCTGQGSVNNDVTQYGLLVKLNPNN